MAWLPLRNQRGQMDTSSALFQMETVKLIFKQIYFSANIIFVWLNASIILWNYSWRYFFSQKILFDSTFIEGLFCGLDPDQELTNKSKDDSDWDGTYHGHLRCSWRYITESSLQETLSGEHRSLPAPCCCIFPLGSAAAFLLRPHFAQAVSTQ